MRPSACVALSCLTIALIAVPLQLSAEENFTAPTPAELAMTSEPKAPGAAVEMLSYSRNEDVYTSSVTVHVRLKILTEAGLEAGTIELPIEGGSDFFYRANLRARTIHRDGTVVPYKDKPHAATGEDDDSETGSEMAMPSVQVGSILEYILQYTDDETSRLNAEVATEWQAQWKYFAREAHFKAVSVDSERAQEIRWVANVPAGVEVKRSGSAITMDMKDVPAAEEEEMMPPAKTVFYNVRFYAYDGTRDEFWGKTGGQVDDDWKSYYEPRKGVKAAVAAMLLPADNDEQKLRKLYAAVMKMENTDLTRERSREEDKRSKLRKVSDSDDVWTNQRGTPFELTMLFVAMARAAGFKAYPIAVASRDRAKFDQEVLSWRQLDSMLAIVVVNGHDVFFDPGTRLCPFADLASWHSHVIGVASVDKFMKIEWTPTQDFRTSRQQRLAELTMAADGSVTGTVKMAWIGTAGVGLRLKGLREDQKAVETELQSRVEDEVPAGIQVEFVSLEGLGDGEAPLVATFKASGKLGEVTAKRIVLPAHFFASTAKPVFSAQTRTEPISFPSASQSADQLVLHLAAGMAVESVPATVVLNVDSDTAYQATAKTLTVSGGTVAVAQRTLAVNRVDYPVSDYVRLRTYYGQIAASDQEPIVVRRAAATASAGPVAGTSVGP